MEGVLRKVSYLGTPLKKKSDVIPYSWIITPNAIFNNSWLITVEYMLINILMFYIYGNLCFTDEETKAQGD